MSRVFTTSFLYKGETYTAIVYQTSSSISIRVADPALQHLLPEGKIVYSTEQKFETNTQQLTPAHDLIFAILASMEANGVLQGNIATSHSK